MNEIIEFIENFPATTNFEETARKLALKIVVHFPFLIENNVDLANIIAGIQRINNSTILIGFLGKIPNEWDNDLLKIKTLFEISFTMIYLAKMRGMNL